MSQDTRNTATGTFAPDLKPLDPYAGGSDGAKIGRMSINKTFTGDITGSSIGEMVSVHTPVKGSAGYVAIEQVSGSIGDKPGTFVLQHFGIMAGGNDRLILEVVPDSGTGELVGLSGTMTIDMTDGGHSYAFNYSL